MRAWLKEWWLGLTVLLAFAYLLLCIGFPKTFLD